MMTRNRIRNYVYAAVLALFTVPVALTATAHEVGDGWQKGEGKGTREQMRVHRQDRIDALDTDDDGQISFDEFQASDGDRFSRFDQDGDGSLTLDEMKESAAQRADKRLERRFARMDVDGNGTVTRDEIQQQMFDRMDTNDDGYLTGKELRPRRPGGHGMHGRDGS